MLLYTLLLKKMPNKWVVFGCNSGYATCEEKGITTFLLPLEKPYLLQQWKIVQNGFHLRISVICIKHFEEKFIIRGKKNNLMWSLNLIPTINTQHTLKRPSTLPTPIIPRKAPKVRIFQKDQSWDNYKFNYLKSSLVKNVLKALAAWKKKSYCFLQYCV